MQWCSEVYITGEFVSFFYVAFDAGVLGNPSRLGEISI